MHALTTPLEILGTPHMVPEGCGIPETIETRAARRTGGKDAIPKERGKSTAKRLRLA